MLERGVNMNDRELIKLALKNYRHIIESSYWNSEEVLNDEHGVIIQHIERLLKKLERFNND